MPQKHSKNNGSSTYGVFSYGERKQCSFMSSIDERTGADAQLPFGWCALSLQPAKDPVCTPSGHIYSRESLLEHMVSKGDELKAARAKWDADRAREAREAGQQRNEDDRQLLLEFEQTNDATRSAPVPKRQRTEAGRRSDRRAQAHASRMATQSHAGVVRRTHFDAVGVEHLLEGEVRAAAVPAQRRRARLVRGTPHP